MSIYLKEIGSNNNQFVVKMGYTQGFLNSSGGISESKLMDISIAYPSLDMNWLLTGKGDMIKNISENSQSNLKQSISDDRNNIDEIINQKIEEVVMEHLDKMIDTIMKRMNQQIDSQNKHMREVLKIQSDDNVQNFKVLVDAIKEIVKEEDVEKFERKIVPLKAKIGG